MNPCSAPMNNVSEAKDARTYRASVLASVSQVKTATQNVQIGECWVEQQLVMDWFYAPWRNAEIYYLAINIPCELESFPKIEKSQPQRFCAISYHREPSTRYTFTLSKQEFEDGVLNVEFFGYENDPVSLRQVITFTWQPSSRTIKTNKLSDTAYWIFAVSVYLMVILPLLFGSIFFPSFDSHKTLGHIQSWLYKIHQPVS